VLNCTISFGGERILPNGYYPPLMMMMWKLLSPKVLVATRLTYLSAAVDFTLPIVNNTAALANTLSFVLPSTISSEDDTPSSSRLLFYSKAITRNRNYTYFWHKK